MELKGLLQVYEFITEMSDIGVRAIDAHGMLVVCNEKMKELEGVTNQEVEKRTAREIIDFRVEESLLQQVLHSGQSIRNHKKTFWNQKGQEITTINNILPIDKDGRILGAVEFARDISTQEFMMYQPLRRYGQPLTFETITAVSAEMKNVISTAKVAATSRIPVMLIGESGTGKDMIAEGIHHTLSIPNEQFITLICRRDEETVIAQLEKYITENKNITFFGERIEYLSMSAQEKIVELLKIHETKNHVFIASIGGDPIELISNGKLSKSLYFFFSSITIRVPSLRERKEDIMPFVNDYFLRYRQNFGSIVKGLSDEVEEILLSYDWPGNLKELEVLLDEIASLVTTEEFITYDMLPAYFRWKVQDIHRQENNTKSELFIVQTVKDLRPLDQYIREVEDYYVIKALEFFSGNVSKTAQALGMKRQSLQYRMKRMKEAADKE
ncbi:sigma 54-interacting transcriptional regulator [Viridibacillus sp. YIM B01967]|uniref:Sigma 54-interacting transcriptional regulator n=1 Tax=Viridibacillus soli TaxID=2798301 RepID=A0ABS1H648_9BACL|nr:sigma 54-interacting transcriptional regulator [Viridibacillus soli]MBK3494766.1 sigma 54-interacting transcriptional regulator [Viridibacillus soli]